jgi:hypothetical protein
MLKRRKKERNGWRLMITASMYPVILILALGLVMSKATLSSGAAIGYYDFKIDKMSTGPKGKADSYKEGETVNITCYWSATKVSAMGSVGTGYGFISDSYQGKTTVIWETPLPFGDEVINLPKDHFSAPWTAKGPGIHTFECKVEFTDSTALYKAKEPDYNNNRKTATVNVSYPVKTSGWPTSPIIVTPEENQKVLAPVKILVKPRDPYKNCTDNGVLMLSKEKKGPKLLSKPLPSKNCKPEGAIWELDLNPGVYQIRAKHTNNKYNFASDWSNWVTFEVLKK